MGRKSKSPAQEECTEEKCECCIATYEDVCFRDLSRHYNSLNEHDRNNIFRCDAKTVLKNIRKDHAKKCSCPECGRHQSPQIESSTMFHIQDYIHLLQIRSSKALPKWDATYLSSREMLGSAKNHDSIPICSISKSSTEQEIQAVLHESLLCGEDSFIFAKELLYSTSGFLSVNTQDGQSPDQYRLSKIFSCLRSFVKKGQDVSICTGMSHGEVKCRICLARRLVHVYVAKEFMHNLVVSHLDRKASEHMEKLLQQAAREEGRNQQRQHRKTKEKQLKTKTRKPHSSKITQANLATKEIDDPKTSSEELTSSFIVCPSENQQSEPTTIQSSLSDEPSRLVVLDGLSHLSNDTTTVHTDLPKVLDDTSFTDLEVGGEIEVDSVCYSSEPDFDGRSSSVIDEDLRQTFNCGCGDVNCGFQAPIQTYIETEAINVTFTPILPEERDYFFPVSQFPGGNQEIWTAPWIHIDPIIFSWVLEKTALDELADDLFDQLNTHLDQLSSSLDYEDTLNLSITV